MDTEAPTTEDRLRTMLDNVRTATANTRQMMDSPGDEQWVQDGESDAEYLMSIQRDTIARLDATARDIEALLTRRVEAQPAANQENPGPKTGVPYGAQGGT
jgi:hypothetical protein